MNNKPTILVVYNYNRHDFLTYFHACKNHFNFFFAEFASPKEVKNYHFKEYGKDIYWGEFKDAFHLLEKIKPAKVVFLYIESYFHMALNIACKVKGIPTFLLDHGIQDPNVHKHLVKYPATQKKESRLQALSEKLSQGYARLCARLFLIRTITKLPHTEAKALKYYMSLRKGKDYIPITKSLNSDLFYANTYLSISPKVGKAHRVILNYTPAKTYYFGVPTYDHLSNLEPSTTADRVLIFIDQGLHTAGFLGWTAEFYEAFTTKITEVFLRYGYKIFVKKHPRQLLHDWQLLKQQNKVSVINDKELTTLLPATQLVIGFFSTYLLPLMALPHTTVLTLENHPAGRLDVSKSFIEAGVAHPVYTLEELAWALEHIGQLHQQQLPNKAKFTEDWLYKFDGKAGERLRDILLSEEL